MKVRILDTIKAVLLVGSAVGLNFILAGLGL